MPIAGTDTLRTGTRILALWGQSPDLVSLIERIFRYTYNATKVRDTVNEPGHEEKLEELIHEARPLQDSLLNKPSH